MNVERIKAAVSAGLPVCWMNHAYSVLPDTGAASGFSVVYDAGGRKENRIGLTWSDGETLNGNPADFFVDYRVPAHVVDDALAEHTAESILNQECRFVAFQVGDDRVWVAVFSYLGGWGLRAAGFGAAEVDCVDVSARAVEGIRANIARNGFGDRARAHAADAFEFLRDARAERRKWDVVILDPPAFVKRKKDFKEGSLAYRRLHELGMQVLERDGILVPCSCSPPMPREALVDGLQAGARHLDRQVQLLEPLSQSPDHPVHPAIPETDYLKGVVARVLPA